MTRLGLWAMRSGKVFKNGVERYLQKHMGDDGLHDFVLGPMEMGEIRHVIKESLSQAIRHDEDRVKRDVFCQSFPVKYFILNSVHNRLSRKVFFFFQSCILFPYLLTLYHLVPKIAL